ncbi:vesicle-associated membrane protein-associated protein B-like [Oppia nitens]|uniref:vesicle-associated membrane protein-associated protein B-like n=1 Tax=Oppia nitens TaxID=1686743 RepID=UPI0023DAF338|nr:vesicle-associated membrane protein-associated protein B-like [Oppia nitens]
MLPHKHPWEQEVPLVEPKSELHFTGPFNRPVVSRVRLTNPSGLPVCYKVKTTAPNRYFVRSNSGLIGPYDTVIVVIALQPLVPPPTTVGPIDFDTVIDSNKNHKFMIQTMFVAKEVGSGGGDGGEGDVDLKSLWMKAKPEDIMNFRLKCVFNGTYDRHQNQTLMAVNNNNDNEEEDEEVVMSLDIKTLFERNKRLREELAKEVNENIRLKEDLLLLKTMKKKTTNQTTNGSVVLSNGKTPTSMTTTTTTTTTNLSANECLQWFQQFILVLLVLFIFGIFIGKML